MSYQQNKAPFIKTAGILGAAIVLIVCVGISSDGSITALLAQYVLFLVGIASGLAFSIAVMIAIFFASVAMNDKNTAIEMWGKFKSKFTCPAC